MIRGPLKIGISHISIYIYIRVGLPAVRPNLVDAFGQKLVKSGKILSRRVRALGSAGAWWVRSTWRTGTLQVRTGIIYRFYQNMTYFCGYEPGMPSPTTLWGRAWAGCSLYYLFVLTSFGPELLVGRIAEAQAGYLTCLVDFTVIVTTHWSRFCA